MKYICCFDGSGCSAKANAILEPLDEKDFGLGYSNILRLHLLAGGALHDDDYIGVPGQHSLYVEGAGELTASENICNLGGFNFMLGVISPHVRIMFNKLEARYEEGDQIYVFGFSRGAAAAREFCSALQKKGIQTVSGKRVFPDVEFLGLFDCCSMQFLDDMFAVFFRHFTKTWPSPERLGEKKGIIGDHVKRIVHMVQLDDNHMWGPLIDTRRITLVDNSERLHEVWMPGSHSDSGGNYYSKDIADTAFDFLKGFLEDHLTLLDPSEVEDEAFGVDYEEEAQAGVNERLKEKDLEEDSVKCKSKAEVKEWMKVNPSYRRIDLNTAGRDNKKISYRPLGTWNENKIHLDGKVNVHESVLEHLMYMKGSGNELYTDEFPYNLELKKANFQVVGAKGVVNDEKTKLLKEFLATYAP